MIGIKPAKITVGDIGSLFDAKYYKGAEDYQDWFTMKRWTRQVWPYLYYKDEGGWILLSAGPDRDYDIDPSLIYKSSVSQPSFTLMVTGTFDPTNGTYSNGDIWRVKQ